MWTLMRTLLGFFGLGTGLYAILTAAMYGDITLLLVWLGGFGLVLVFDLC